MGAKDSVSSIDSAGLAAVSKLLAGRRSVRRYLPDAIPAEVVDALLDAAVSAPSAHNRQPWRFLVLTEYEAKAKVAQAMGERLRADRTRDGDALDAIEADVARSFARLTGAPVVIVVSLTLADMDVYPDEQRGRAEHLMAVQGTAMAVQNLLLAAHAAGLGACWICAPLFCPDAVAAACGLPADWQPQAIVTLGYPANAGKPYSRRALGEVVLRSESKR